MLRATITINGLAYGGEDPTQTIAADVGGGGWHVSNHQELDVLLIGGPLKTIVGRRGLASELDRILRRMEIGALDAREIVITIAEEG